MQRAAAHCIRWCFWARITGKNSMITVFKGRLLWLAVCFAPAQLLAADVGSVRGIVHDEQHLPIAQASVQLKSATSTWQETTTSDTQGDFAFMTVPLGDYVLTVTRDDFATTSQAVTV